MRTAVFITPESLLSHQRSGAEYGGASVFHLASQAVKAITRLKKAGFLIIGLGRDEVFQGFATQSSCAEFLSASSLDDVIIPKKTETPQRCATAMIHAASKWLLDLDRSFFIGQNDEDFLDAQLTGCTPLRIMSEGTTRHDLASLSTSFPDVVEQILALDSASDERF